MNIETMINYAIQGLFVGIGAGIANYYHDKYTKKILDKANLIKIFSEAIKKQDQEIEKRLGD